MGQMGIHRRRETCRACGSGRLRPVLSLGRTPLANAFVRDASAPPDPVYPLEVFACDDCTLVQLIDVIRADRLFSEYLYVTGASATMTEHFDRYAAALIAARRVAAGELAVEIGSNDGSLLCSLARRGVRALGVEPARNLAEQARARGTETINAFFDASLAAEIRRDHGPARVVVANNVLAHVDDTPDFLRGCRTLIEPGGTLVVEVPYLRDLIDRLEYDTIYHEHLCYFSATALLNLFGRVELAVERIERVAVHGGSLRVYAVAAERLGGHAVEARAFAAREERDGLTDPRRLERFAAAVGRHRKTLATYLQGLREEGAMLAGYGAPAKGNTLLNCCGIGRDLIPFTVDRNPLKVGLATPGARIPILPVAALLERRPSHVLILAWNVADEIVAQQREYLSRGGRFILPIPEPTIVAP